MPLLLKKTLQGKIVEWDQQKGYGFVQAGGARVFLHHREFRFHHKRAEVGDFIQFSVGLDAQQRTCAKNAEHINDGGRLSLLALGGLLLLLVLPAIALSRRDVDLRWAAGCALATSAFSYGCYALDKRRARENRWRISENILHLTELLGGWPGAFLAQRRLRHKCTKFSYQIVFWLIVLAYQFAAFDSLQNWRASRKALAYIEKTLARDPSGVGSTHR